MRQEAVEKKVVAMLGKRGIPVCIIKGNEIARSLYDDPNCRGSADIDVLVKKSDAIKADMILRSANYTPDSEIPLIYFMYHTHHTIYRDPVYNNLIELHWLFGVPYFFKLSSEEMWEGIVTESDGHAQLSPEMLLIMLLIHHHNHSFNELKILVDLLWAFQKYDQSLRWREFSVRLKRMGLTRVAMISISQLEALWPSDTSRMQSVGSLKQSLVDMGCSVSKYLTSYFRMDLDSTSELNIRDKITGRFALDGLDTIFLSYLKTMFPPPEAIRELYHNDGKLMLPINYLRFICRNVTKWTGFTKG